MDQRAVPTRLSVIMPVYNERATVQTVLTGLMAKEMA
jgi:glycosyltransferase involved in cell wall biosynthesis